MNLSLAVAALAVALPCASFAAHAPTDRVVNDTIRITYHKADLLSPAVAASLELRVRAAAEKLCGISGRPDFRAIRESRSCYESALEAGLKQLEVARAYAAASQNSPTSG